MVQQQPQAPAEREPAWRGSGPCVSGGEAAGQVPAQGGKVQERKATTAAAAAVQAAATTAAGGVSADAAAEEEQATNFGR